jgi:mannose-6-phosphate isomerase-like protein (cupin superfamily)
MKENAFSMLAEQDIRSDNKLMNHSIAPSAGETLWVVGHRVTIIPAGEGYSIVDVFSPAHTPGPPPHRHQDCTELFHVLQGRVRFHLNDSTVEAGVGESILIPRNVIHTFNPACESDYRMITVFAPGGFDCWFRDMGVPAANPNARALSTRPEIIERIFRDSHRYHMQLVDGGRG